MRNVEVLGEDPLELYDAIANSRHEPRRSRLRGIRRRIECAYLRYYVHAPTLERQRPLGRRIGSEEADDLRHCYTTTRSDGSAVHHRMHAKILKASYTCAYCGIVPSTTLDHYLPKDGKRGYPELSLLPANLVPSCSLCNNPRGFLDASGRRVLIHPYFDVIPQERLLVADVSVVDGLPDVEFRVDLSACSNKGFGQLYDRHVGVLGLLHRYRVHASQADSVLNDIQRTVRNWVREDDQEPIVASLLRDAEDHELLLGANHYKTVLTRGAAASRAFLDFCQGRTA